MRFRISLLVLLAFLAVACGSTTPVAPSGSAVSPSLGSGITSGSGAPGGSPASPSPGVGTTSDGSATGASAASAPAKPYKAKATARLTHIVWASGAGPVPGVTSTFDGRCSVPSDYVITFGLVGEATHLGRFTGEATHCSQLIWTPDGPVGATYGDGQFTEVAANGDAITGTYTDGTSGTYDNGMLWFRDEWTMTGGTGRFAGATGHGEEGGTFTDFTALLSGTPMTMWLEGTIAYSAGNPR